MFAKSTSKDQYIEPPKFKDARYCTSSLMAKPGDTRGLDLKPSDYDAMVSAYISNVKPRRHMVFGSGRQNIVPGIDGKFPISFPLDGENVKGYVFASGDNGRNTDFVFSRKESTKITKALSDLDAHKNDTDLLSRLQTLDEESSKESRSISYHHLTQQLDVDEINLVTTAYNARHQISAEMFHGMRLFSHMASLHMTGEFHPRNNFEMVFGYNLGGDITWLDDVNLPGPKQYAYEYSIKDVDQRQERLKAALQNNWFENDSFTEPLNVRRVLSYCDRLADARNSATMNYGQGTSSAAIGVEQFVTDLSHKLGVANSRRFVDNLRGVGKKLGVEDLLEPFVDIYTSSKNVTPSMIRAEDVHGGVNILAENGDFYDRWAIKFYEGVAKTLLSSLMGEPNGYYEFDMLARERGMIGSDSKHVASLSLSVHK